MTTNQTFTNDASRQILVLTGHGTTGRRVVQRLRDGVQRALGRPPRRFDDFCARAARAGTWSAAISAGGS